MGMMGVRDEDSISELRGSRLPGIGLNMQVDLKRADLHRRLEAVALAMFRQTGEREKCNTDLEYAVFDLGRKLNELEESK